MTPAPAIGEVRGVAMRRRNAADLGRLWPTRVAEPTVGMDSWTSPALQPYSRRRKMRPSAALASGRRLPKPTFRKCKCETLRMEDVATSRDALSGDRADGFYLQSVQNSCRRGNAVDEIGVAIVFSASSVHDLFGPAAGDDSERAIVALGSLVDNTGTTSNAKGKGHSVRSPRGFLAYTRCPTPRQSGTTVWAVLRADAVLTPAELDTQSRRGP